MRRVGTDLAVCQRVKGRPGHGSQGNGLIGKPAGVTANIWVDDIPVVKRLANQRP